MVSFDYMEEMEEEYAFLERYRQEQEQEQRQLQE